MTRLTDKDELYMDLVKTHDFGELTAKKAIRIVANAPTIEAEPVRHGKWVEHVDDRWGASHYFCSECGNPPLKEERTNRLCLSTFCPNCGARMDKKEEPNVSEG